MTGKLTGTQASREQKWDFLRLPLDLSAYGSEQHAYEEKEEEEEEEESFVLFKADAVNEEDSEDSEEEEEEGLFKANAVN